MGLGFKSEGIEGSPQYSAPQIHGVRLMITALYASLLAIPLFILSIGVIGLRGNPVFVFIAQVKVEGIKRLKYLEVFYNPTNEKVTTDFQWIADDEEFFRVPKSEESKS